MKNVNEDTDLSLHKGEGDKNSQISMNDPDRTRNNQNVEEFYIKTEEMNIEDVHWDECDSTDCEQVTGTVNKN